MGVHLEQIPIVSVYYFFDTIENLIKLRSSPMIGYAPNIEIAELSLTGPVGGLRVDTEGGGEILVGTVGCAVVADANGFPKEVCANSRSLGCCKRYQIKSTDLGAHYQASSIGDRLSSQHRRDLVLGSSESWRRGNDQC